MGWEVGGGKVCSYKGAQEITSEPGGLCSVNLHEVIEYLERSASDGGIPRGSC